MSEPTSRRRVGWLGGSFDPIHDGHLALAHCAAKRFDLEQVLLIPAARPPHKEHTLQAPPADRLALIQLATASDPLLSACDLELKREGPSYSIHTAQELRAEFGQEAQIFFIIGADTLADLPNWYRISDLCNEVTFCAAARPGTPLSSLPMEEAIGSARMQHIQEHLLEMTPHPASSTAIRTAIKQGLHPEHVPEIVLNEIAKRRLYSEGGASSSETTGIDGTKP
ncbi:MAG: nicotinate (nicotinamide) nucleotide adenylyltransferase [Planctomycetota bacterium]|jgi:nicotinate-nucleotide adenylyltransferase|nr:nicotinate (nicotinamide) nucleotide adenylyltransferase [Planctomycetota bacterium]